MATVKLCWQLLLVVTLLQLLVNHQIESKAEYQQKEINILLLLSFEIREPTTEQPWFVDGPMNLPAAELAVEQINQREDVLGGFLINLTVAMQPPGTYCSQLCHIVVPQWYQVCWYCGPCML